ncbi:MAG: tetratricopeptide repeat protein [Myxococcota bacterium]|nr:tetratricopeptide repeat protein [Myxococcota bacterium]
MQTRESERLETLGVGAPGAPGFAALAEARRREGQAKQALELLDEGLRSRPDVIAGRVARVRALLDLGRLEEAQAELGVVLERVPDHPLAPSLEAQLQGDPEPEEGTEEGRSDDGFADLAENELEAAFEEAEAQPEEMMDANRVAEATLRDVESEGPEGVLDRGDSPFATQTMADLLERQGHAERAETLRTRLEREQADAEAAPGAEPDKRARVVRTLERWLNNLRRDT